jgi:hypothetical protein
MYWRYAVPHWFSIYTLRVRIRAWGFRYFRFYPLRGPHGMAATDDQVM